MRKFFLSYSFLCFLASSLLAQSDFNLSFEKISAGKPDLWTISADQLGGSGYLVEIDSSIYVDGNNSLKLSFDSTASNPSFGAAFVSFPAQYEGKKITLLGNIKTKDVEDGFAGLWLRIDGRNETLEFNNMADRGITGTLDWNEYSITLPLPEDAHKIYVGGLLTGKGEMWMDDLKITIDGPDLSEAPIKEIVLPPASLDTAFANGSGIKIENSGTKSVNRLFDLCKIWGYVKYYHPEVAAGNHNMDAELFRILPKVLESEDHYTELSNWIESLGGELKKSASGFETDNEIKLNPPVNWLDRIQNDHLRNLLIRIYEAERPKNHYYISFVPNILNPVFENENPFPNMDYTDDGVRILSLFRYWNMIQYWFPYRHLMDKEWNEVLREYIPKFLSQDEEYTYKLDVLQLIGRIQDTHANIWSRDAAVNEFWGQLLAPVELANIESKWAITRIFDAIDSNVDVRLGDVVTHINGRSIDEITNEKIHYCPASNRPTQLRDLGRKLLRTNKESISITLERNGSTYDTEINTTEYLNVNFWNKDFPSHKFLSDDVGYIYPASLNRGEIDTIMEKMMDKKGIVLDLRCYPSDFIVFSMGKYVISEPTPFVKFTNGDSKLPGRFTFKYTLNNGTGSDQQFSGKLAILINETTQSQAEYTTMALRVAPNAQVFGSTTAAADGNVSAIYLPGNVRTMISGIGVYYPDGTETQRIGIIPDVMVRPTIQGIRNGNDEVLQSALEWIKS